MIKIIDLFAGIGGIRKGFEIAFGNNVKCVMTSEIDKYAIETYKANYGDENMYGDIKEIKEEDVPDHDILLAGFPCQPFSQAGLKKGFNDTRGTLFFDIERILIEKQPQAFLLENVKQLKGHDKGHRDFGVPQNRERIFIVGFLDHNIDFEFPTPTGIPTRVGDILEDNVDKSYTFSDKLWAGHQRRKEANKLNGKGFGYGLFDENSQYTNTISARYYKDGSEILIAQKGKNPRKLTPREAARLQGFPEDFIIDKVSNAQTYKQFGNSVCVPVIAAVAKQMKKHIKDKSKAAAKRKESKMELVAV